MNRTPKTTIIGLVVNILYSAYYMIFGAISASWWLFTVGVYYCILSTVRFVVLRRKKNEPFLVKFTGWMLMLLSVPLAGTVMLSAADNRGHKIHLIAMLTIAVYAFTKITLAAVKLIKSRHSRSEKTVTLRNISFADAFVSIFSLQRSMLVSFEGMTESGIVLMNVLTGTGVCIIVFLLGLNLVRKKKVLFKALDKS